MIDLAVVAAHRRSIADLSRLAANDLRIALSAHGDPERARDDLLVTVPALVSVYGAAAATLGADWYDDLRPTGARRFRATPAEVPGTDRTDSLTRWAIGPLFSATPDRVQALDNLAGSVQQLIADADRNTITMSATEDPVAKGWERVTHGGCDFCRMLAGRVFGSDQGASFHSHPNCGCTAVPIFG